jgi:hypothetical protein
MHDPFGNAFVVEVGYLLPKMEIFEERRSAHPGFKGVLIIIDT